MNCNRLKNLVRDWYLQVQDETMAPARMVTFMKQHVAACEVCQADAGVELEVEKIKELVLPPSKEPKAFKEGEDEEEPFEIMPAEEEGEEEEAAGEVLAEDELAEDEDEDEDEDRDPDFDD